MVVMGSKECKHPVNEYPGRLNTFVNVEEFTKERLELISAKVSFIQNKYTFLPNSLNFGIFNAKGMVFDVNSDAETGQRVRGWAKFVRVNWEPQFSEKMDQVLKGIICLVFMGY